MTSRFWFLVILSCASFLTSCNAQTMRLTLNVNAVEFEAGQVVLEAELKNEGQEPVELLLWATPLEATLLGDLYQISQGSTGTGQSLPYQGRMVKRAAPGPADYVVVNPGESLRNTQRLSEAYPFCANGSYRLEFTGVFVSSDNEIIATRMNKLNFTTGPNFPQC